MWAYKCKGIVYSETMGSHFLFLCLAIICVPPNIYWSFFLPGCPLWRAKRSKLSLDLCKMICRKHRANRHLGRWMPADIDGRPSCLLEHSRHLAWSKCIDASFELSSHLFCNQHEFIIYKLFSSWTYQKCWVLHELNKNNTELSNTEHNQYHICKIKKKYHLPMLYPHHYNRK